MNAQKIVIEKNSPQEVISKAYAVMIDTYKRLVRDYCFKKQTDIDTLIANAECPNRREMQDFLNDRTSMPAPIDLERGMSYCRLEGRFVDEVPVEISREVINPQPLTNAPPKEMREEIERKLGVLNWFYLRTTERAMQQAVM